MSLADRVRGILRPSAPALTQASVQHDAPEIERTLGGEWRTDGEASSFVVERRVSGDEMHGRMRVADIAARLDENAAHVSILNGPTAASARPPFVFFDLETTGLSGGAGTYAFLVGCGTFAEDGAFVARQYLMTRYGDERQMLQTLARELDKAGALISFNGKSFDAPLIETRYQFHRLEWSGARLPHVDALHPARQFWGNAGVARPHESSCSLTSLETQVLGARRVNDVPGFEIPARYFQFVRSGDARPLAAVLEHNRRDLLSLAGLTARLLRLVAAGPGEAGDAREALALGRVYSRSGLEGRARDALTRAIDMTGAGPRRGVTGALRIAALHALAICERRARRFEAAAGRWRAMLEMPECPVHLAREATEALAIHHEHRVRDLPVARMFALRSLETEPGPARQDAVRRRVTRIDRKMERNGGLRLE
jgi:uncharacterized protein YprB with RNaseH-like and TPR domain